MERTFFTKVIQLWPDRAIALGTSHPNAKSSSYAVVHILQSENIEDTYVKSISGAVEHTTQDSADGKGLEIRFSTVAGMGSHAKHGKIS
jgi:hypothetical protein